ncbi:MAG: hypothetical protein ACC641_11065, partial [Acidiferrobacterales bacterium]
MHKFDYLIFTLIFIFISTGQTTLAAASVDKYLDYPRVENFAQGSVKIDFPTIKSWTDFRFLEAWVPIEISLNGDSKARIGSVRVQAVTDIDFDQRTVRLSGPSVLETRFIDADPENAVIALASRAFSGGGQVIPLDVLLRLLPEDFAIPTRFASVARLNFDPPAIVVSETPLKLLSIDKEPIKAQVEGTSLEFVVNTNWNVFYDSQDQRWYVLNDGVWQTNNYLSDGGWTSTDELPADFDQLAANDEWWEVQQALPAKLPVSPPTPFIISLQVTELIQLDGAPRLSALEDTGIYYVRNTRSDLFKFEARWYFLVSGRWFSNNDLSGPWQSVKNLPDEFSRIPPDHKTGHVLFSVPGTRQAKLALIEAALPHRTSVGLESAASLKVSWVGEPRFVDIETTQLQRGLNTPYQVIRHNNFYYLSYEGGWYFSVSAEGPWQVALEIPAEIYRIPPTDPAYNVTFVRLDDKQDNVDEYVDFSYSSGYTGSFSTTVSVVYGTGWNYPANVFWDPGYQPVYWHHRPTYGHGFGYNPIYASFGSRYGLYQPWGYSTSIEIESPTVEFTHGYGSAWEGPLQTAPGDPTETAEQSLDDFLPAKKSDGTEKFVATSKDEAAAIPGVSASSLYAGSTLSSNMFSGPNGEVYRHE